MIKKIFVYGTLKKGYGLNQHLGKDNFICEGRLKGFDMYGNKHYPAIVKGNNTINGEIYKVSQEILQILDSIEVNFDREVYEVTGTKGKKHLCYVYVLNYIPMGWEYIKEGEWMR